MELGRLLGFSTVLESADYIAMTIDAMEKVGVRVEQSEDKRSYRVYSGQYSPFTEKVEGDWSQAGFWYAATALGSAVELDGMNENSSQGDRVVAEHFRALTRPGDRIIDVSGCPDLVPPLAVMAAVREGTTYIVNAARLRIKESDRLASVTNVLNALGTEVEEFPDRLTIRGLSRVMK